MSSRPGDPLRARVLDRRVLSPHLVRLRLGGLAGFTSTGIPDEWVALTVPGQFQTRYYTVRSVEGPDLVLDVVVHEHGLVTEWVAGSCAGDEVGISVPKGSFDLPEDAGWVVLVGDLTALPAIARITEHLSGRIEVTSYLETPAGTSTAYPDLPAEGVTWVDPPAPQDSGLARLVRGIVWPQGPGYFWMAGESAQMREIRRHLRHDVGFDTGRYDVMGYWSGSRGRRTRGVDPGPLYLRGKQQGRTDAEIWADYDDASQRQEGQR